jgi:saccharopine dehydrogenase (NADP+, L-glutamate forming)/spermidine synthase
VAGPLVRYFLEKPDYKVKVGDLDLEKAQTIVAAHPRGQALRLDLRDEASLSQEIRESDIVVGLVPYTYHPFIAKICIQNRKNMVTTSYAGEPMKSLDEEAKKSGIIILNEVGLDPGIDHMEAARVIHEVKSSGEKILGFISYCGGLPAPDANTNPFGYKFSWSPRGVLLAGKNPARYLKDGQEVFVPAADLFDHYALISIEGLGEFEGYPNRNSLPYVELYGIPETQTMFRGTLRYPGWCRMLSKIGQLGLLDQAEKNLAGLTYLEFMKIQLGNVPEKDTKKAIAFRLNIGQDSDLVNRLEWLGLMSQEPIPLDRGSALDILEILMLAKLRYQPGERDMIVLRHDFLATGSGPKKQRIVSTLIDYGIPDGDSSMARTVGLPAAIGTRLILEGKIQAKGVMIPVLPEIYEPILAELSEHGIVFKQERMPIEP